MKLPPIRIEGDKVMAGSLHVASLLHEFPEETQVVELGGAVIGFVHQEGMQYRSNGVLYKSLTNAVASIIRKPGKMGRPGGSKYHNARTVVDGITFDSKKEAKRWRELTLRQQAGEISLLERQVSFPCVVNGKTVCTYRADFTYYVGGVFSEKVVEDVKGFRTEVYKLKKKLVEALYGIEIKEV